MTVREWVHNPDVLNISIGLLIAVAAAGMCLFFAYSVDQAMIHEAKWAIRMFKCIAFFGAAVVTIVIFACLFIVTINLLGV